MEIAALLQETDDGEIKVGLRSNEYADTSEIAASFNGGGHRKASGYTVGGPMDAAVETLLDRIEKYCGYDNMDGFINLLKPIGPTSFQAVSSVKRITGKKAGHTGTLDPALRGTAYMPRESHKAGILLTETKNIQGGDNLWDGNRYPGRARQSP